MNDASTNEEKLIDIVSSIASYLIKIREKGKILDYSARDVSLIEDFVDSILKDSLKVRLPQKNENLLCFQAYYQ